MRPPPEVVALIDELVARLDQQTLPREHHLGATSNYEAIAVAWERFKALVDRVDLAVSQPLVNDAGSVLLSADALVGIEVDKLAFWLRHLGEAIRRFGSVRR